MSHATVLVVTRDPSEAAIEQQMAPFDENQPNAGWFADGTRWDWWQIGGRWKGQFAGRDQVQVKELRDPAFREALVLAARRQAEGGWVEAQTMSASEARLIYDLKSGETQAAFVKRTARVSLACYAFLHERHWHEQARMGWFGAATATECERASGEQPSKCVYVHPAESPFAGARIICWSEGTEKWDADFERRFLRSLDPALWLTVVDYHV